MAELRYAAWMHMALLAAMGWALWRQRRSRSADARVLRAVWCGLFLVSWAPFATLLMAGLEAQAPRRPKAPAGTQAIVVLSGGLIVVDPWEPRVLAAFNTEVRSQHAAWLYGHGWRMPVVASGGDAGGRLALADVMAATLERHGVAPADIWKESGSLSTHESARAVAAQLHARGIFRILLVTEAYHMPRAVGLFRKAGFEVVASPCYYRTREFQNTWQDWLALTPKSMHVCEAAAHEWLAFARAWVMGWLA